MTLGELIKTLERKPQESDLIFDFVYAKPDGMVHSYRGDYAQLAIGYGFGGEGIKVKDLLATLKGVLNTELTGYKGGEHTMHQDVDVYVANPNESGQTLVVDVVDHSDSEIILRVQKERW